MEQVLPTVQEYKHALDHHVDMGDISVDQAVILLTAFVNHSRGKQTHVKAFMDRTGLQWKEVHYQINGLVMRGALKKIDKYWYGI
jgi:sRNA-binding regulator protein Hfq